MDEFKEYSKRNKSISDNSVFVVNSETSMNSGELQSAFYFSY